MNLFSALDYLKRFENLIGFVLTYFDFSIGAESEKLRIVFIREMTNMSNELIRIVLVKILNIISSVGYVKRLVIKNRDTNFDLVRRLGQNEVGLGQDFLFEYFLSIYR